MPSTQKLKLNIIALLSAIPLTLSIEMVHSPLNWLMLVPTFFCGIDASLREAIKRGAMIGTCTAIINLFWMLSGSKTFTGHGIWIGLGILFVFCTLFSAYSILVAVIYVGLRGPLDKKYSWLILSLQGGALFTLLDAAMMYLGKGFSTCMYVNYIPFATNIYAIQPASLLGPLIITFVVAMIDYQFAYFLFYRKWKMLWIPCAILLVYLGWGAWLYQQYTTTLQDTPAPTTTVAILEQNLSPQYTWDSINGDRLADQMFAMNSRAVQTGSQLFIWSETAIPWTYTAHDAFIHHIDSITSPYGIVHLLGMNTDYKGRTFYNSIYALGKNGQILGRYDKREALYLVEKPFLGILLPFFTNQGFRVKEGVGDAPLPTPWGKAGILLCNESVVPGPAARSVQEGANFLVNSGNDGWFADTYIPKQHFFHARLRAVENRKDIVINNNNGYSGMVKSSGDITLMERYPGPNIGVAAITPNGSMTPAATGQKILIVSSFILLLSRIIYDKNKKHER
ncbi:MULTISPECIES: apolipoprotein N-acyltransferase [Chitinophagaceae]